jgi:hypothetical protein
MGVGGVVGIWGERGGRAVTNGKEENYIIEHNINIKSGKEKFYSVLIVC